MPLARRTLSAADVRRTSATMFALPEEQHFGVELEWPVHRRDDVMARPNEEDIALIEGSALPAGSRITFEPGGQVELSTAPAGSIDETLGAAKIDTQALWSRMDAADLKCEILAVDGRRPPDLILQRPRYQAMEQFFAARGAEGSWMMCNTASTQVNISHAEDDPHQRWYTMHRIGPALVAAFANSPGRDADGQPWMSLRQAIWWSIDPARTRPVRTNLVPELAWQEYALAADVMFINADGTPGRWGTAVRPGLPFARWMRDGHPRGWPTIEDYRYHLTTLFPPVRPRGWLELRVLDALPDWIRDVAVLTAATACTNDASRELSQLLPDTGHLWKAAAHDGLRHPVLDKAAGILFDVVTAHLGGVTADGRHADALREYAARYVRRGQAPANDMGHHVADLVQNRRLTLA